MKKLPNSTPSYPRQSIRFKLGLKFGAESGFALIATISVMALVIMIAMAMVSLSTSVVRTSNHGRAMEEAQANARMALALAIGKLQQEMGPDQRISANANILDDPNTTGINEVTNPHWTGVWDSWKAGTGENSQHSTIGGTDEMAPTYETNRSDHFRGWLLSLNPGDLDPNNALNVSLPINLTLDGKLAPAITDTDIRLVGAGSLSSDATREKDYVSVRLLSITDPADSSKIEGRYGWWIGDESQKARLISDSYQSGTLTAADKIFRAQAPASMGNRITPGLESLTDEQDLAKVVSHKTLDLVSLGTPTAAGAPTVSQVNFHTASVHSKGVLVDVREGGLKRDLSTILEQPIRLEDNGPEFMLYEFDDPRFPYLNNPNDERRANSRVPIQDLAAYYQLYDHEATFGNGRREGVQYTSTALPNTLQIKVPDHDGGTQDRQRLIREYTSLYRRPVITKVQFLVGMTAQPITQADRDRVLLNIATNTNARVAANLKPIRDTDTHRLRLGLMPVVTLWNPSNLPLVMEATQRLRYNNPPFGIRWRKERADGEIYESTWFNLGYANNFGTGTSNGQGTGFDLLKLRFAPGSERIVFEPGEVKVFSIPNSVASHITDDGRGLQLSTEDSHLNTVNEWDPFGVFLMRNSAAVGHYYNQSPDIVRFDNHDRAQCMVFNPNDKITFSIEPDDTNVTVRADGRSSSSNIGGAGFSLLMVDEGYQSGHWSTWKDSLRHTFMLSRNGSGTNVNKDNLRTFHGELMYPGFPGGEKIQFDDDANTMPGSQIIAASELPEPEIIGVMDYSLSIGCESSSAVAGGFGGGRRITSRPFLHSATAALPFITQSEKDALYDYGWDWQVSKINTIEDSIIQAQPGTGRGYYGGGYTVELGTTHVIQSEIPVLPPISIASLSQAHLGGFSLAYAIPVGENPDTDSFWWKSGPVKDPTGVAYQRVTASGQNGLSPHIVQAIGNSYAHPNIPANKAFVTKSRTFDLDEGPFDIPFVDHSYLANKALWDEFFFSSIAPQPSKIPLYDSSGRTAKQVADDFFFNGNTLPNRRITPYNASLDQAKLDTLFTEASIYTDGLADKLAAHLMVNGAFNINSTSVEAWKVFLSSLKGKPVSYLNGGTSPQTAVTTGTTFSGATLPSAAPIKTEDITGPNLPPEQWKGGRELTEDEISELAYAIVRQVKLRGPFLSLSEFVNRRLDGSDTDKSLKGTLQAALDDENVTINAKFRLGGRILDLETAAIAGFEFPQAAEGPIAYGSSAYVDQADILRNFSAQLTPRGDTFVIRTYGDSIDNNGEIVARAWCEAVVQRIPEYVDSSSNTGDEPYTKQSDLTSETNKIFGRQLKTISFRWLNADEV